MVIAIIVTAALLLIYSFIEPYWQKVRYINIFDEDIPASFEDMKIVFMSDIHHGPLFSIKRVERLVERVNKLNPDLVILGGDYVYLNKKYIVHCFEALKRLKPNIGTFGVLGNHDHWEDAELTRQCMKRGGIALLDNHAEWINVNGERIKVGGVGDYMEDIPDIGPTIEDTGVKDFVILVSHNPDYAEEIDTDKIDLMLAGHTHGGQVTFFGLWAPLIPSGYGQKYRTGVIDTRCTKLIVSNGVGTIAPPVRFFARPEINVIILKNE